MHENNNSIWSCEYLYVSKYSNGLIVDINISFAISRVDFIAATKPMINVSRGCFDRGCLCLSFVLRPSKYDAVDRRISSNVSLDDDEVAFYTPFLRDFLN